MRYVGPNDIARSLNKLLARARVAIPPKTIEAFFQVLFFASQRTEEGLPIRCHLVYLDPANPDPSPPKRIRLHRWSITRLSDSLELSDKNLSKLARATDYRCSSVAVFHDKQGALFIWGMVDHDNQNAFHTHDAQSGPEMPGLFQSSIEGVGNLTCYFRDIKVSELRHGQLARQPVDVLREGPIRRKLNRPIRAYLDVTDRAIPFSTFQSSRWKHMTENLWVATLCRLIIRVRSLRKGASFLITDKEPHKGVSVKYSLNYHRLQEALQRNSILKLKARHASESVHFGLDRSVSPARPILDPQLFFTERNSRNEYTDSIRELDNALWFVSMLTRVDGALLLRRNLQVRGFGVEITTRSEPRAVFVARTARAEQSKLTSESVSQFGTRHRSMFRFCNMDSSSIGIVISQDGDVRFITKNQGRVVMWDNIRLRLDDYLSLPVEEERSLDSPN